MDTAFSGNPLHRLVEALQANRPGWDDIQTRTLLLSSVSTVWELGSIQLVIDPEDFFFFHTMNWSIDMLGH